MYSALPLMLDVCFFALRLMMWLGRGISGCLGHTHDGIMDRAYT
jgi:hypothetical protein